MPSKFLFSVWTFADHMAGYEQQDAHEFMIALLDGIETHLRKYHSPPPLPSPSSLANKHDRNGNRMAVEGTVEDEVVNYKVVSNLFSGLLESEVRCAHCGCISTTTEPFLDLSLSLDQALRLPGKEHIQGVSLQTCIDDYATAESLSTPIYCENCKEHRESVKKLSIRKPPKILAVHLKRFDAVSQRKVHTRVNFPLENFDISPYMQSLSSSKSITRHKWPGIAMICSVWSYIRDLSTVDITSATCSDCIRLLMTRQLRRTGFVLMTRLSLPLGRLRCGLLRHTFCFT